MRYPRHRHGRFQRPRVAGVVARDLREMLGAKGETKMKYLIALLLLSGCTRHYDVGRIQLYKQCLQEEAKVIWTCRYQSRFSISYDDLKQCDTKEECNDYCDKARKE